MKGLKKYPRNPGKGVDSKLNGPRRVTKNNVTPEVLEVPRSGVLAEGYLKKRTVAYVTTAQKEWTEDLSLFLCLNT